jgi:hypothetical protein
MRGMLGACMLAVSLWGQVLGGDILGVVTDPTGAVIARARVLVRNGLGSSVFPRA